MDRQQQQQQQQHDQYQQSAPDDDTTRIQSVFFLRHGIAMHNLLDPISGTPPDLYDPSMWDPPLVDRGMKQALDVRERIQHILHNVEMVVTSPLSRCLQTAHLVFFPGTSYDRPGNYPPIVCMEQVREAFGMHYPDKRRDKSILQQHWPFVHFDAAMAERDEQWSPSTRETVTDVETRVQDFLDWLVQRNESNIFVVSHGVWIESCFDVHFPEVLQDGMRVYNCDCFWGEIVSQQGRFVRIQNLRKI